MRMLSLLMLYTIIAGDAPAAMDVAENEAREEADARIYRISAPAAPAAPANI